MQTSVALSLSAQSWFLWVTWNRLNLCIWTFSYLTRKAIWSKTWIWTAAWNSILLKIRQLTSLSKYKSVKLGKSLSWTINLESFAHYSSLSILSFWALIPTLVQVSTYRTLMIHLESTSTASSLKINSAASALPVLSSSPTRQLARSLMITLQH